MVKQARGISVVVGDGVRILRDLSSLRPASWLKDIERRLN